LARILHQRQRVKIQETTQWPVRGRQIILVGHLEFHLLICLRVKLDNNTVINLSPPAYSRPGVPGGGLSSSISASGDPSHTAEEDPRNTKSVKPFPSGFYSISAIHSPPETESDLRAIGNTLSESSLQSRVDSGNQADPEHVSTFVIWPAKSPPYVYQASEIV
jgi:hypothetical protein